MKAGHPLQLITNLVINNSVTTSPTLAGERMLLIPKVSILSEQIYVFKELTPRLWTYELHGLGKNISTNLRQTSTSHCPTKPISKNDKPSLKKRKRKAKKMKQIYKISKKGNKKKSCHLVPKVVIDLSFGVRKVEESQKYRRRERVPKAGSRREETITEPINSCIGEFHYR